MSTETISTQPLLIELGCEELPPKDLNKLSESFAHTIQKGLIDANLAPQGLSIYSTPRRLAVVFEAVMVHQADQISIKRGPTKQSAYLDDGTPSKAAEGFARSVGVSVDELQEIETDKGPCLGYELFTPGAPLAALIAPIIEQAMKSLPISKRMRWGEGHHEFVRPIHWFVGLLGEETLSFEILGIKSDRYSRGHRIHHPEPVFLSQPHDYQSALESAYVLVNPEQRKNKIYEQIQSLSDDLAASPTVRASLLEEVTGLVEWPVALVGTFDERFLSMPEEVLTISMEEHQRYFALRSRDTGAYLNQFIFIANLESMEPHTVIQGNERVIEPRFADAEFFWDQDQKHSLAELRPRLDQVVFHKAIGTVGERVNRIERIATLLADRIQANAQHAGRIALLCKCDLLTDMVQEFPELQGTMGRYYAQAQGEEHIVAEGIESHYQPKFSGDMTPTSLEACAVAIADKLDSIMSLFSIQQFPTGSKDPYALRRAALGIIRIILEKDISISLSALIDLSGYAADAETKDKAMDFIIDRYRNFAQKEATPEELNAVLGQTETINLRIVHDRLASLIEKRGDTALIALANAAKRSQNLLKERSIAALTEDHAKQLAGTERALLTEIVTAESNIMDARKTRNYSAILDHLSQLAPAINEFFENVMIMDDDLELREQRLGLLARFVAIVESDYQLSALSKQS